MRKLPLACMLVLVAACRLDWTKANEADASGLGQDGAVSADAGSSEDATVFGADAGSDGGAGHDCDGGLRTFYRDQDGDGVGSRGALQHCSLPGGYSATDGDCDDASPTVYPGAQEACNGIDDDCNAETEDGLAMCDGFRCEASQCLTSCAGSEGCVEGLACVEGLCRGTLVLGSVCIGDPYCASGACECANENCSEKRCAEERCSACRFVDSSGAECIGDVDGAEHAQCTGQTLCRAGQCLSKNGSACGADAECLSGSCEASVCRDPVGVGGSCDSSPDCAEAATTACTEGGCKYLDAVACSGDEECASGSCFEVCKAPSGGASSCDSPADCLSPHTCGASGRCTLANDEPCATDDVCESGSCGASEVCQDPVGVGLGCDSAGDCTAGLECSNSVCRVSDGQPCEADQDCVSLSCSPNQVCAPRQELGGACNGNLDCVNPLICRLTQASGAPGGGPLGSCRQRNGTACTSSSQCAGACTDSVCVGKSETQFCFTRLECLEELRCPVDPENGWGSCAP